MTSFLQSQLPKVYENSVSADYSKVGFTSTLCRALKTVGMVPLVSIWPFDIMVNPERVTGDGIYVFPFDYPDASTFRVQSTLYRPLIYVVMYVGDTSNVLNPTRNANAVVIDDAIRVDGAVTLDTIFNKGRDRAITGQGYGLTTSTDVSTFPNSLGQYVSKADWQVHLGHAGTDQSRLSVGHWFVYLGPAGLFVYAGSGATRTQFGDLMAYGNASVGGRIPGRARPVLEDANFNRINPMISMPLIESGAASEIWTTNVASEFIGILRTKVHRMQHDLKVANASPTAIVNAYLYNLENLEYPIRPYYGPDTRPSPRVSSTGGGAHILGRVILVPDGREDDATQLFGPVVSELDADDVRPQWEDVFTGEGIRFCDVSAPLGVRIDPNTNKDWYLVPAYNAGYMIGLLLEPNVAGTIVDQLSTGTLLQTGDDHYNMTTGGYAASFPNPVTHLFTPSSGNGWTNTPGQNAQTTTVVATTTAATHTVDWTMSLNATDPSDTLYQVQCTIFNKDSPQSGTASAEGFNRIDVLYSFQGAFALAIRVECAGANVAYVNTSGGLSFNSVVYTGYVAKDTTTGTPRIVLRFSQTRDDPGATTRGSNGEVRALHIIKSRYL